MARIFMDGFESGSGAFWSPAGSLASGSSVGAPQSNYVAYLSAYGGDERTIVLPSKTELYISFKHRLTVINRVGDILILKDAAGNRLAALGTAEPGVGTHIKGSTTVASFAIPDSSGGKIYSWHTWEIHVKLATDSTGIFAVKYDGIFVYTFTGITAPSAASAAKLSIASAHSIEAWFDDIIVDDASWIGNPRILAMVPNSNGSNSGFTSSTGGNNYTCVDEVPPSSTDYVYGDGLGLTDSYGMSSLSATLDILYPGGCIIKAVQVQTLARYEGVPTTTKLTEIVKSGITTDEGTTHALTYTPQLYASIWQLNPDTGNAWTAAELESIECGIKTVA